VGVVAEVAADEDPESLVEAHLSGAGIAGEAVGQLSEEGGAEEDEGIEVRLQEVVGGEFALGEEDACRGGSGPEGDQGMLEGLLVVSIGVGAERGMSGALFPGKAKVVEGEDGDIGALTCDGLGERRFATAGRAADPDNDSG